MMIERPPIWIVMSLNDNREASIHAICTEEDRAELYKKALDVDEFLRLQTVWIDKTEANHLWVWNLAKESRPINARDYLPQLEHIDQLETVNAALLEALETIGHVADTPYPVDKQWLSHFVTEAIRKAKSQHGTLKGE